MEASRKFRCDTHAYVLMTNHIHLLVTGRTSGALSAMMHSLGRRYVRYFNRVHARTGTLFEGRFKSSLVDTDSYLFTCYRYIELNPVRAGLVTDPGAYRWSSHGHNALGAGNAAIREHPEYQSLGSTPAERQRAYRELFRENLPESEIAAVRMHANKDCALGPAEFQSRVEGLVKRRARIVGLGRPKRTGASKSNLTPYNPIS
jgi:putative transposase